MSIVIHGRETTEIEDDELPEVGITFATLAEDQIINRFAKHLPAERRVYVDAGAYDPIKNSNTLLLFKRGWKGVNIDANAEAITRFRLKRPNDINIHAYLAATERDLIYAEYESVTTNRLFAPGSKDKSYKGETPLATTAVRTQTLDSILSKHLPPGTQVGYLNVDCEGLDLDVLVGCNLQRWRPGIVTIEGNTPEEQAKATEFLVGCDYELRANIIVTQVFTDRLCPIMHKTLRYKLED